MWITGSNNINDKSEDCERFQCLKLDKYKHVC